MQQEQINEFVMVAHGDLENVQQLLAANPALLNQSATWVETALGAASHTASLTIVRFLLEQGAEMDVFAAIVLGEQEHVLAFLDGDAQLVHAQGPHGIPIFIYPAIVGNTGLGEELFRRGADVNVGAGGMTALHGTAYYDQTVYAKWLIDKGANVNVQDYEGKTPLQIALEKGNDKLADLLRAHGATE